jgi:hypothetical protein
MGGENGAVRVERPHRSCNGLRKDLCPAPGANRALGDAEQHGSFACIQSVSRLEFAKIHAAHRLLFVGRSRRMGSPAIRVS